MLNSNQAQAIELTFNYSRYAQQTRHRFPALIDAVLANPSARPPLSQWQQHLLSDETNSSTIDTLLRDMRRELMLRTIIRDLALTAPFDELVTDLSSFADIALKATIRVHSLDLFGTPQAPYGFSTVAMGKLGAEELNASSDIDIIYICDRSDTNGMDRLNQLAKRITRSLNQEIAGSFVHRIDTRLRPYGDAGPMVPSLDFIEQYLVSQGRMWERLAWLKARIAAGPLGKDMDMLVTPFVYRRYLDFDAIEGMRELHSTLRAEKSDVNNIKLGRGGIRELEFGVQLRQLVRAGRDPSIRIRKTIPALNALAKAQRINPEQATQLSQHYLLLRRVEHVLQYRDDLQTQTLPRSAEEMNALAQILGYADANAFNQKLEQTRHEVASFFDGTLTGAFGVSDDTAVLINQYGKSSHMQEKQTIVDTTSSEALQAAGYTQAHDTAVFIHTTLDSVRLRTLPSSSRQRFDQLVMACIRHAAQTSQPDAACKRTLDLLVAIASRSSYLALMVERPQVLNRVVDLAATSDWALRYVTKHPLLLDELMDGRTLSTPIDYTQWRHDLQARFDDAGDDAEQAIDSIRHFQQSETFRLLLKDIAGLLPLETLSDHLSALADAVVDTTLKQLIKLAKIPDDIGLAVIAYGRWGGKELGYASDLDLIFLLSDDAIECRDALTRVAQKLQNWLITLTAAGRAYDIDVRLRPDGAAGLLLSAVSAFSDYQQHKAWTWEHQALTRARYAAGNPTTGAAFEQIRNDVIAQNREWNTLRQEIIDMRHKVIEGHPNKHSSELFDIKHDGGGLVDMEFSIQALVLRHSHLHPSLRANHGNIALARHVGELDLIDARTTNAAADAYRTLRSRQHAIRLQGAERAVVPVHELNTERNAIRMLWEAVFLQD